MNYAEEVKRLEQERENAPTLDMAAKANEKLISLFYLWILEAGSNARHNAHQ